MFLSSEDLRLVGGQNVDFLLEHFAVRYQVEVERQVVEHVPHDNGVNENVNGVEEHENTSEFVVHNQKIVTAAENVLVSDCVIAQKVDDKVSDDVDEVEQSQGVYLLDQTEFMLEALHSNH